MVARKAIQLHTPDDLLGRYTTPHNVDAWDRLLPPLPVSPTKFRTHQITSLPHENMIVNSRTLRSFSRFKSLPPEIRSLIWLLTLPGPRIVPILSYGKVPWDIKAWDQTFHRYAFHSPAKPPVTLFVNRESRAEARRFYTLTFGSPSLGIPNSVWFNYAIDTLYFEFDCPNEDLMSSLSQVAWFTPSYWSLCNRQAMLMLNSRRPRCGVLEIQKIAVSHRVVRHQKMWSAIAMHLRLYSSLVSVSIGIEREDFPWPRNAVLEAAGMGAERSEELMGLQAHVEGLKIAWETLFLKKGVFVPMLELAEVRPRGPEWTMPPLMMGKPRKLRKVVKETTVGIWKGVKVLYLMRRFLRKDIFDDPSRWVP